MATILSIRHSKTIDPTTGDPHYTMVDVLGGQGIRYQYNLLYGKEPTEYYKNAGVVFSIKGNNKRRSTSKKYPGKIYPTGAYQPIGDTRYFNFKQLQMTSGQKEDFAYDMMDRGQFWQYLREGLLGND